MYGQHSVKIISERQDTVHQIHKRVGNKMAQIALFDTEQLKKEILDFIDTFVRMKFENRYLPEHETEEAFAPFRESF